MNAEIITSILVGLLCLVLGIMVLIGKGDWAISGYNTASPEEKAQYNIRRLRLVIGLGTIIVGAVAGLSTLIHAEWIIYVTVLPVAILILILTNTWAKD